MWVSEAFPYASAKRAPSEALVFVTMQKECIERLHSYRGVSTVIVLGRFG